MKLRLFFFALLTCTLLGCGSGVREQNLWAHVSDDPTTPEYENFYEEFSKYPGYAIAEYPINESYDTNNDLKHLQESVRQCRAAFGKAYREKRLLRPNPVRGAQAYLPFQPRFLVVAIKNNAEHTDPSTFAASFKVAYILPMELVFSEPFDFAKLLPSAYVDRAPFAFDAPSPEEEKKGWSPDEKYHWLAIERHEARLKK